MKAAKSKQKAGITGVKLIVLLIFVSIPVLKTSSLNVTITSRNSDNGDDHPLNYMMEQAEYPDTNRDNNVHQTLDILLQHEIPALIRIGKAVGVYILMCEYSNHPGIYEAKGLSP